MKRTVMDMIEAEFTESLELREAEMQALTEQVDFARVQKMTMDRIQEEPQNRKATAGRIHWRNSPARRIAALVAILVICLGGTVFAVQKGYFEAFFGIDSVSDGQILRVNDSRLSEGVKMTLAEMIPGETDSVATIAFERADGKPFPENVHLAKFDVALGTDEARGCRQQWKLSEDGRQLLALIEIHGEKTPILGKTLTIDASTIYNIDEQELEIPVDLAAQYDALPIQITVDEMEQLTKTHKPGGNIQWRGDIEAGTRRLLWSDGIGQALAGQMEKQLAASPLPIPSIPMPKSNKNPDIQFAGLGFLGGKLCLGVSIPEPKARTFQVDVEEVLRNEAALTGLLDRRNGQIYLESNTYVYLTGESRAIVFTTFEREGLTEEDLAYLTPLVTYEDKECISEGQWNIAYTFDKSVAVNLKTDLSYNLLEGPIQITDISISVLDVKLYGKWINYEEGGSSHGGVAPHHPEVRAIMKDGTEIALVETDATALTGAFFQDRYVLTEDGSQEWKRRFIDEEFLSQLEGIMVDGTLIPLEQT